MHSSLHLILANESIRSREASARKARVAASVRRPLAAIAERTAPPQTRPYQWWNYHDAYGDAA